jgi:hypothetical protein
MNSPKFLQQAIGLILVVSVFLAGCATPTATPTLSPTLPPPPPTFPPPPPTQTIAPTEQQSLFRFIQTVKVTPSGNFLRGGFVKIGYVQGNIVVAFNTNLIQPEGGCPDAAYAYKEYTTDMVETGAQGVISCKALSDTGGVFFGDDLYFAAIGFENGKDGWWLEKFNAITWEQSTSLFYPMASGEGAGDPMLAFVNGQLDVSSMYQPDPTLIWGPFLGAATFHDFFNPTDLQFVSKRILSDTPHIGLSSMITANDTINFISGTALFGDVIVMQYDTNWNYLGTKTLIQNAGAPEGVAFDGNRFYISYLDIPCTDMPCETQNVRLAAFDANWNLLDDIAVTSYAPEDHKVPARPTLLLWNGRLYVGYDGWGDKPFVANVDPAQADLQAFVSVYELTQKP